MAEKFTFTYQALGDTSRPPSVGPTPAPLSPPLQSFDIFPTRIWQAHLRALAPQLEPWVKMVLAMRAAHPEPAGRTVRQGWNSEDMAVLEGPDFAALKNAVRAACAGALGEMGVGKAAFRLQSWVNMHDRGGFNFLHMHEGSLLSGGFYLQVPAGSGQFVFRDPRPGVILGSVKGGVPNGHADVHLTPSAGLLVLFPCWMDHYVEPHDSDEPRITIAFNALEVR
ncbi:MAG TPA: TIGR02466 family protein [Steroidobacteraceae bacterium]|nr:TIGR02466 family protein [Steroidobacteraceae bacterium]